MRSCSRRRRRIYIYIVTGSLRLGWIRVRLITHQDPYYFTHAGHEFLLTRIVKGSNDTAGRGREASVYERINLLTGFTENRHRRYHRHWSNCHCRGVSLSRNLPRSSHESASAELRQFNYFHVHPPLRGVRSRVSRLA